MWKQLIVPTLVVSGLWLMVTPLTAYSIYLLDQSYRVVLTRNLVSARSAGKIREDVWRITSYAESGALPRILPELSIEIDKSVKELREAGVGTDQEPLVAQLTQDWHSFLTQVRAMGETNSFGDRMSKVRKLRRAAESISAKANEIRDLNHELWAAADEHREHWQGVIRTARFVLVVLGPAVGIALGWWMSQRLHRSISQINIILKDATVEWEQSLAELRVGGREDLSGLRERVEKVVERMRQVSSELAVARRETLRSERLATVGELAAGVAHELRNPLTSVKLLLQNAAQQPGDTKLREDESRVVLDEILRMESTIQGLLDLSRPPSAQRQRHELRDTLQRALNLVQGRARHQKVQIQTRLPDGPMLIDGDPEQLHQLCVNLLINGVEAMVSGGNMEIYAESVPNENRVRVCFHDHGPGIPESVLAHVFEPFVSTKARGTGLGLAISRRIAIQHGGLLTAENHPEGGALITLELPLAVDDDSQTIPIHRNTTTYSASA